MPFDPTPAQSEPPRTSAGPSLHVSAGGGIVSVVFAIIGIGLLAGAAAAYWYLVERPQSWPRASATVTSSRVVNPSSPSQYTPELVFSIDDRGTPRQVTAVASWSSSSYEMVKSYVDRYPAGTAVSLAVNPEDPDDVRYELGLTLTNAILPGALGVMGVLFTVVGLATRRSRAAAVTAPAPPRSVAWIGTLFMGIGLVLAAIGGWLLSRPTPLDWPTIDAQAVDGAIIPRRSSSSRGSTSRPSYDIQVTFTYTVNGTRYTSQTASGSASGTRDGAARRLEAYASGTTHTIRHRPDDPNVIRFEVTRFGVLILPLALLFMGVIFTGVGFAVRRSLRPASHART